MHLYNSLLFLNQEVVIGFEFRQNERNFSIDKSKFHIRIIDVIISFYDINIKLNDILQK